MHIIYVFVILVFSPTTPDAPDIPHDVADIPDVPCIPLDAPCISPGAPDTPPDTSTISHVPGISPDAPYTYPATLEVLPESPDISPDVPNILPLTEIEPPSEPFDADEDDDSYHDTQEDATDSSEHSPLKSYCSPDRRFGVTRSCPGTPDTHHPSENIMFGGHYRERKGSLGSIFRGTLPTIGSVLRQDFR